MNRQIAEKADLFFMGLQGRYDESKDFFRIFGEII